MRNVVSSLFISLDGVAESPDQWQFDVFDDVMMDEITSQIAKISTVMFGRVTYQEWASYWPTSQDEPFASFINNTPKVVVSSTLDQVAWGAANNISLIKGNVIDGIKQLKQQEGQNIGVNGSPTLVQWLLQNDLLDRLQLVIHPVVAGHGKRLFKEGSDLKRLTLVENKTTSKGVVMVTYERLGAQS